MQQDSQPLDVFISYAPEDQALRNELIKHLASLRHQNLIHDWHDDQITPGTPRTATILAHLNAAQIILLLISADYLASDFCYSQELEQAIARHEAQQARVIPIILRPVNWQGTLFAKLQPLPTNAKSVTEWHPQDRAFTDIAAGIRKAIEGWKTQRRASSDGDAPSTASPTAVNTGRTPLWNLPFGRNLLFTGREDVLAQLHTLLHTQRAAFVSQSTAISGLGGIGKTQTAVEYAYRHYEEYQYILWVQANTAETLTTGFVALAQHLHLPEQAAQDQTITIKAVKGWLAQHTGWLLIFDNADELTLVDAFLPIQHQGHVLFTTRSQSMSNRARRVDIEQMPPEEGALFLLQRSGLLVPDTLLTALPATTQNEARALVEALDGLPLALDQAGAYLEETSCTLSHYLTLYQSQRKALHIRRSKYPTDHPEPVATTWAISFANVERANPAAAELLCCCAFLSADSIPEELFSEGAAYLGPVLQAVANDPLQLDESLSELLRYSLVHRSADTHSLRMHRLVQAVLRDEMDPTTQEQWAARVVHVVDHLFPFGEASTWPRCQRYLPHAMLCADYIREWKMDTP